MQEPAEPLNYLWFPDLEALVLLPPFNTMRRASDQ